MRLINAEELLKILQEQQKIGNVNDSRGRAKAILEVIHAPTVDAEPVKHGRWIIGQCGKDKYIKCSVCKARIVDTIVSLEGDISQDYFVICPRCGARMDLKDGDNT